MFVADNAGILGHYTRPNSHIIVQQVMPPGPRIRAEWHPPNLGRHGGDPKYVDVARPLRVDADEYTGQDPHTRAVTLLFDGWAQGRHGSPPTSLAAHRSVEDSCRIVHSWTRPVGGVGSGGPMPQLRVVYGPWQQLLWKVRKAMWAEPLLIDGHRVRQEVTLGLREAVTADLTFTPIDQAVDQAVDQAAGPGGGATATEDAGTAVYIVVSGDSLWAIAAAQLGDPNRWPEIATLNNIPGPAYTIHPGDELKLPAA